MSTPTVHYLLTRAIRNGGALICVYPVQEQSFNYLVRLGLMTRHAQPGGDKYIVTSKGRDLYAEMTGEIS